MINFGPTFIWTAINLLILFFVLRKVLFNPVTRFMNNRTKLIRDALETAENNKTEALKLKAEYESQLKNARVEAAMIIEEAHKRANKEYEDIIKNAKADAQAIIAVAKDEIEQERVHMLKTVKNQVAELALLAASKVMEANMDSEVNRALVNKFIDEAGAA